MKQIQLSSLGQSFSQCQIDKPGQVWAIGLPLGGVPLELIDDISEKCKKWVGWGFGENSTPFLLFENKEEAFIVELSLGKNLVYN